MSFQEVAYGIGVLSSVVAALRWLLGFYFRKAKELENLRAENQAQSEKSIAADIANLKAAVAVFRQELNAVKEKMAEYAGAMRESGRTLEIMQKQLEKTVDRLEERYAALDGAEVVKVGKDTFIFKTRANGR